MFTIKLLILFVLLIAAAGYFIKKAMDPSDEPAGIEEVVAELLPLVDDPRLFHRHLKAYLGRKRIYGEGTISRLPRARNNRLILPLRRQVTIGDGTASRQIDILIDLTFYAPDAPTEIGMGDFVEFTGILIDVRPKGETLTLQVEISELLYIGEKPPETDAPHEDVSPPDL